MCAVHARLPAKQATKTPKKIDWVLDVHVGVAGIFIDVDVRGVQGSK